MERIFILTCILGVFAGQCLADENQARGLQIARDADQRFSEFGDSRSTKKMVLIRKSGEQVERVLRVDQLESADGQSGDKTLIAFVFPRDIRGTALLTWSHGPHDHSQWLYLPALRRVKTVTSSNKSGPFVGSEFSFEDMKPLEVEEYTYTYLRDEPCGTLTCYVVDRFPIDKDSGYSRQTVWLDTDEYRIQKIDFFDRQQNLLKTLTASDYRLYQDRFWRASKMVMQNHRTGDRTELYTVSYQFGTGLTEADFTKNSLMRVR